MSLTKFTQTQIFLHKQTENEDKIHIQRTIRNPLQICGLERGKRRKYLSKFVAIFRYIKFETKMLWRLVDGGRV